MQLARDCTPYDLREFFNKGAGKVRDVKIIADRRASHRTKGIAYVEFREVESVMKAHHLAGQRLLGAPVMVMPTQAEKSRAAAIKAKEEQAPKRITLANLSPAITKEQLMMVFEPFGKIRECQVFPSADPSNPSTGVIFFDQADVAQMACEQLNNFFLVDRPMRLNLAVEVTSAGSSGPSAAPAAASSSSASAAAAPVAGVPLVVPAASRYVLLQHMFNPAEETDEDWDLDIRDEVLEECSKHGPIVHMFVDKASQGCIYIKFQGVEGACTTQAALHGRFLSGRQIVAEFLAEAVYLQKCPSAANAETVLTVE